MGIINHFTDYSKEGIKYLVPVNNHESHHDPMCYIILYSVCVYIYIHIVLYSICIVLYSFLQSSDKKQEMGLFPTDAQGSVRLISLGKVV